MRKNSLFSARKKGFTLAELIITIGIILILSAIVAPSVVSLQRKLKANEMDSYAKNIYQVAQTRLITLKGTGEITNLSKINSYDDKNDNAIYWLNTNNYTDVTSIKTLVPTGTIEETVRNSNYVIEYDPNTAMVLSVYYFGDTKVNDAQLDNYRKNVNIRALVKFGPYGYFKGGNVEERTIKRSESLVTPVIVNDNELYAKVYLKKNNGSNSSLDLNGQIRVTLNGLSSGSHQLLIDDATINTLEKYNDSNGTYIKVTLDNLGDNQSERFATKFSSFMPGEDINVEVQYKAEGYNWSKKTSSKGENSLFASVKTSYVKGIGNTAYIENSRHLQNLDPTYACLDKLGNKVFNKIEQVQIKNNITWPNYLSFAPIANENLNQFEGNNHVIKNITIDNNSTLTNISVINSNLENEDVFGAGLFAYFKGNSFKNISLDNIIISNPKDNITYIGGLIGYADSSSKSLSKLTIDNCRVYTTNKSNLNASNKSDLFRISANSTSTSLKAVGGFIGYSNNAKIINCSSSYAKIDAQTTKNVYTGGFIGLLKDTTINDSYSFFGFNNQGTWLENTGLIQNSQSNDRLGGFIGQINITKENDPTVYIENCFAVGVINSKNAYSFTYGSSKNKVRINNSYSMVLANVDGVLTEYGRFSNKTQSNVIFNEDNPCYQVGIDENNITGLNKVMLAQFPTIEMNGFKSAYDNKTITHTYGLSAQTYPYLTLENTEYYGDWPIATVTQDPYEMVYYEVYKTDDDYSIGFYNKDLGIDSLMSEREEKKTGSHLVSDGYALLIKSDDTGKYFANESVELAKVCEDLKKTQEILYINVRGLYLDGKTYENSTYNINELATSINATTINYRGDSATKSGNKLLLQGTSMYYPIFLGSNIINSSDTNHFYARFGVHYFRSLGGFKYVTINQDFLVNFNYAKSKIIKTTSSGSTNDIPATVSIRTERQFANFKNMSTKYSGMDFEQERNLYFDTSKNYNTPLYYTNGTSKYLGSTLEFGNEYSKTKIPTNLSNVTLGENSVYDGNNHIISGQKFSGNNISLLNDNSKGTIKNLTFKDCSSSGTGNNAILVSNINNILTIENLKFENCIVSSENETDSTNTSVGILASTIANSNSKVRDITITNSKLNSDNNSNYAGLAIGKVTSSSLLRINSSNDVTTTLTSDSDSFGGLFGVLDNSKVTSSSFIGNIECAAHNVGLFVGTANDSIIEDCNVKGELSTSIDSTASTEPYYYGGFAGTVLGDDNRIINSHSNVTINKNVVTNIYTAGFVANSQAGKLIKCYVLGENKNSSDATRNGGFVANIFEYTPIDSPDFIDAIELAYVISNAYDYSTIESLDNNYIETDYKDSITELITKYNSLIADVSKENVDNYYSYKLSDLYLNLDILRETNFNNLGKVIDNISSSTVINSINHLDSDSYINSPLWSIYNEIYRLVKDTNNEINYKDKTYDYRRLLAYNFIIEGDIIYTIPNNIYYNNDVIDNSDNVTIIKFNYKDYLKNLGDPSNYIKYVNDNRFNIQSKISDNSITTYLEELTYTDSNLNMFTYCGFVYDTDSNLNNQFIDFESSETDIKYRGINKYIELYEISGKSILVDYLESLQNND